MRDDSFLELAAAISKIDAAVSADARLQVFRAILERYGFRDFLITGLPVPHDKQWHREILCDAWPREWYLRYLEQGHFLHDPCAAWSRHMARPFLWHQLPELHLTARGRRVMEEAAEFGMKDGLCVPIHVPLSGPAVVTAAGDRIDVPPASFGLIETLCVHTFRVLGGLEQNDRAEQGPLLTPREREILQWSAGGKVADDIACILGITKNTVESHQRNIRDKLGAINVTHAVAKALKRQEIQV
jgi:LuxR family quorum sensing-dependent transcriptional regulator